MITADNSCFGCYALEEDCGAEICTAIFCVRGLDGSQDDNEVSP